MSDLHVLMRWREAGLEAPMADAAGMTACSRAGAESFRGSEPHASAIFQVAAVGDTSESMLADCPPPARCSGGMLAMGGAAELLTSVELLAAGVMKTSKERDGEMR